MRRIATVAGVIALLLVAIVLGGLPPVARLAAWIEARKWPLLAGAAVLLALGLVLFLGGIIKLLMDRGTPLSHDEVEDVERSVRVAARPVFARAAS
jgi:hypothetical protein